MSSLPLRDEPPPGRFGLLQALQPPARAMLVGKRKRMSKTPIKIESPRLASVMGLLLWRLMESSIGGTQGEKGRLSRSGGEAEVLLTG